MAVHYPIDLRRYLHYRKKNDFVVVKIGASWCSPCRKLTPILESLAAEHKHVYFVDIDVDNPEMEHHEDLKNVKTIPHLKFFVNGVLEREVIGLNLEKINRYVTRYSEMTLKEVSASDSSSESDSSPKSDHSDHDDQSEPSNEKVTEVITKITETPEMGYHSCPYCSSVKNEV